MPATGFAEPKAVESAIMRYYERNASEENRTCLTPYMDGLTRVAVVDQQPDRLVLDVSYLYRDRFKNDREQRHRPRVHRLRHARVHAGEGRHGRGRGRGDGRVAPLRSVALPSPGAPCMMTRAKVGEV